MSSKVFVAGTGMIPFVKPGASEPYPAMALAAGRQALEDAGCLVFLENEIGADAATHTAYPREKFIEILRKTWRKMSPPAHAAALGLDLPPAIAELIRAATAEPAAPPKAG